MSLKPACNPSVHPGFLWIAVRFTESLTNCLSPPDDINKERIRETIYFFAHLLAFLLFCLLPWIADLKKDDKHKSYKCEQDHPGDALQERIEIDSL
jgi:hypothetical protein